MPHVPNRVYVVKNPATARRSIRYAVGIVAVLCTALIFLGCVAAARLGTRGSSTGRRDLRAPALRQADSDIVQSCAQMRGRAVAIHARPDLLDAFREHLIVPETADLRGVVQVAVDRGEVHPDNRAIDHLLHLMIGAFVSSSLIDERPPTQLAAAAFSARIAIKRISELLNFAIHYMLWWLCPSVLTR